LLNSDSVYFSIRGKSTAGAILPLGEPDWLNWSCDKDNMLNMLGLACGLSLSRDLKSSTKP